MDKVRQPDKKILGNYNNWTYFIGLNRNNKGTIPMVRSAAMINGAPGKYTPSSFTNHSNMPVRTSGAATAATDASDAITP